MYSYLIARPNIGERGTSARWYLAYLMEIDKGSRRSLYFYDLTTSSNNLMSFHPGEMGAIPVVLNMTELAFNVKLVC